MFGFRRAFGPRFFTGFGRHGNFQQNCMRGAGCWRESSDEDVRQEPMGPGFGRRMRGMGDGKGFGRCDGGRKFLRGCQGQGQGQGQGLGCRKWIDDDGVPDKRMRMMKQDGTGPHGRGFGPGKGKGCDKDVESIGDRDMFEMKGMKKGLGKRMRMMKQDGTGPHGKGFGPGKGKGCDKDVESPIKDDDMRGMKKGFEKKMGMRMMKKQDGTGPHGNGFGPGKGCGKDVESQGGEMRGMNKGFGKRMGMRMKNQDGTGPHGRGFGPGKGKGCAKDIESRVQDYEDMEDKSELESSKPSEEK
eukprot:TRINITY_DN126_c0_g1_i3.p1 TRINITY_DN126_c0_g1~~TRINITY_DN126_c0_g1_i3.p1  ORF type:complete len:300 (+),score=91.09 TRINITY_DN126_c0_g1_i3:207-1106(+)